ncbi:MAG TPA: hypothetical protein PK020_02435 [Ilumatobacteraceae bacterium]|nr:hypothetical protein [Ilumatobacteraceae bacterium]HRB03421.1 hypothetical protein [Ilumatobacteraceae bacterium]
MTKWRVLATASIWLVLSVSLWATGARPAVVVLAGIVAVGAALVVSVIDVSNGISDTGWPKLRENDHAKQSDQWVVALRHQMIGARHTGSTELHDRLVSLVDDHADQRLTPTLQALSTSSPRRLGSLRSLDKIITDIEAL